MENDNITYISQGDGFCVAKRAMQIGVDTGGGVASPPLKL